MFFKGLALALCGAVFFVSGCGVRIFEPPPQPLVVQLEDMAEDLDLHGKLKAFAQGQIAEEELEVLFDHLDSRLVAFAQRVRGEQERSYWAQELRGFVHRYFLRDRSLSDSLLSEVMRLKVFFVGGELDRLTHEELDSLRGLLGELKQEAQRMRPFMGFFLGSDVAVDREEARRALKASAQSLGQILGRGSQSFYFDHLVTLMEELRAFAGWNEIFSESRQPQDWVEFLRLFKELNLGESRNLVAPEEWTPFLGSAADWYGLWLRYQYDLVGPSMFYGEGFAALVSLIDDGMLLAHQAVKNQRALRVEYERLNEVFVVLENLRLLPGQVTAQALDQVTRSLVGKMFGDMSLSPQERAQASLGIGHFELHQMGAEFYRWALIQHHLDIQFSQRVQGQRERSPLDQLSGFVETTEDQVDLAVHEFRQMVQEMRPLFSSKLGRIFLVEEVHFERHSVAHGFFNLSAMNFLKALIRQMFRGYSEDLERALALGGITEDELQDFYTDFRPLGIDLRVMDPRSADSGRRSFIEASLFTYSGQGVSAPTSANGQSRHPDILEMETAIEFLSLLFSGGLLAHSLYEGVLELCQPLGPRFVQKDVFGGDMINRDCFTRHLLDVLLPLIGNMPGMQNYLEEELTRDEGREFVRMLVAAGIYSESPQHLVERSEVNTMAMILHYSEAIFTRYNLDGDLVLNHEEILQALPVFSGFIKRLAADMCYDLNEARTRTVFFYILRFAEIPKFDPVSLARLAMMRWPWWSLELDRMQVVRVFGEIIRTSGQATGGCNN